MQSHLLTAAAFAFSAAFAIGAPALSADLPQQGSFSTHSAGTYSAQTFQVGDKHVIAAGNSSQVIYNDADSGPLHRGSIVCTWWFDDVNGSYNTSGACAVGEAGGTDTIFLEYSGKGTDNVAEQGTGTLTGGTGKYDAVQGKVAYQCKIIDQAQRLFDCTGKWDYQLKAASAAR